MAATTETAATPETAAATTARTTSTFGLLYCHVIFIDLVCLLENHLVALAGVGGRGVSTGQKCKIQICIIYAPLLLRGTTVQRGGGRTIEQVQFMYNIIHCIILAEVNLPLMIITLYQPLSTALLIFADRGMGIVSFQSQNLLKYRLRVVLNEVQGTVSLPPHTCPAPVVYI